MSLHPRLALLLLPILAMPPARAAEPAPLEWMTDLPAAQARAAAEHKPLLVLFTGRTWCPPCIALHEEVLGTDDFAALAREHLLVELDYPALDERTPARAAGNLALARRLTHKRQHAVAAFPTVLLLGPDGKEQARRVGYTRGIGARRYLALLAAGRGGD